MAAAADSRVSTASVVVGPTGALRMRVPDVDPQAGGDSRASYVSATNSLRPTGEQSKVVGALKMAVGMLGLEAHKAPNSMAEVWLSVQDKTAGRFMGLCGDAYADGTKVQAVDESEWQHRVLSHVRKLASEGGVSATRAFPGVAGGDGAVSNRGPDFEEYAKLSEFVFGRISRSVDILQGPQRSDRPEVLRDYTDKMVMEICADVAQWLEQVSQLVSLYHIHILDVEGARRELQSRSDALEKEVEEHKRKCREVTHRHQAYQDIKKAEATRLRMAQLIGKDLSAEPKIYSQREVDEMMEEWEKEHVQPLQEELEELRMQLDELRQQGKARAPKPPPPPVSVKDPNALPAGALGASSVLVLDKCLLGLAARLLDNASDVRFKVVEVAEDIRENGGAGLEALLTAIDAMPFPEPEPPPPEQPPPLDEAHVLSVLMCLGTVGDELGGLESRLRKDNPTKSVAGTSVHKLGELVGWARDSLGQAVRSLRVKATKMKNSTGSQFWSKLRLANTVAKALSLPANGVKSNGEGQDPSRPDSATVLEDEELTATPSLEQAAGKLLQVKKKKKAEDDGGGSAKKGKKKKGAIELLDVSPQQSAAAAGSMLSQAQTALGEADGDQDEDESIHMQMAPVLTKVLTEQQPTITRQSSSAQTDPLAEKVREVIREVKVEVAPPPPPAEPQENMMSEEEFNRRLLEMQMKLKAELQAELQAAKQKIKKGSGLQEEIERLQKELAEAEHAKKLFRERISELEKFLSKTAEGRNFMKNFTVGLPDYLKDRDVFNRLYNDAMSRLKRMQEIHSKLLENTTSSLIKVVDDAMMSVTGSTPLVEKRGSVKELVMPDFFGRGESPDLKRRVVGRSVTGSLYLQRAPTPDRAATPLTQQEGAGRSPNDDLGVRSVHFGSSWVSVTAEGGIAQPSQRTPSKEPRGVSKDLSPSKQRGGESRRTLVGEGKRTTAALEGLEGFGIEGFAKTGPGGGWNLANVPKGRGAMPMRQSQSQAGLRDMWMKRLSSMPVRKLSMAEPFAEGGSEAEGAAREREPSASRRRHSALDRDTSPVSRQASEQGLPPLSGGREGLSPSFSDPNVRFVASSSTRVVTRVVTGAGAQQRVESMSNIRRFTAGPDPSAQSRRQQESRVQEMRKSLGLVEPRAEVNTLPGHGLNNIRLPGLKMAAT